MKQWIVEPESGGPMAISNAAPEAEEAKCCLGCGYSLRGLRGATCPECGRGFDPLNSATFIPTESCPQSIIRLLKPIRWPVRLSAGLVILLLVVAGIPVLPVAAVLSLWLIIYLFVAIPCLLRSWARRIAIYYFALNPQLRRIDSQCQWRAKKWLAAGLLLAVFRILLVLMLSIEFPWLSHKAHWLYEKEGMLANYPRQMWFGPMPVYVQYVIPWGVFFDVSGLDVAYSPVHPTPARVQQIYWHVAGDWYVSANDGGDVIP